MNSATLDAKLRSHGYGLFRQESVDGPYWLVCSLNHGLDRWNCKNLKEVKSLLSAIQDRAERGGTIEFDGSDWIAV